MANICLLHECICITSYLTVRGSNASSLHAGIDADRSLMLSLLCIFFMESVRCDRGSADCGGSAATADEEKQGQSVCIREEDGAESVAIRDGSGRLGFNRTRRSLIRVRR